MPAVRLVQNTRARSALAALTPRVWALSRAELAFAPVPKASGCREPVAALVLTELG
jgi:hypothetical protein